MLILIGGCSRSGKSSWAQKLVWQHRIENKTAVVLCQDDFVKHIDEIPKIRDRTDWETPYSIDYERFITIINVYQTCFDVVIVEGHLVFANEQLTHIADERFFIDISEATFRQRRAAETRWGAEPAWFIDHVWESFLAFGQPPADQDITYISGQ